MSGLKDCGVIIIFCFPFTPIINYSNAFCRLTSLDSQVPKRQKPRHEIVEDKTSKSHTKLYKDKYSVV